MGILLSRFKKKESTKEKLQQIQEKIVHLEEYKQSTEQHGKKLVGSLVIYSFILCLIAGVICYFYYLPRNFNDRLLYATPFAIFIILIYLIKRILTWYYHWKIRRNEKTLTKLKANKSEILDQVMETETYKVAKDILETYAPEQLRKTMIVRTPVGTPMTGQRGPNSQGVELRKRITSATPVVSQNFGARPVAPNGNFGFVRPMQISPRGSTPILRPSITSTPRNVFGPMVSISDATPVNSNYNPYGAGNLDAPPGPPMPRPILPRERGILDRFVEYLVGDGPSNRYALVCRQCESHNGMALKEEFPYIAFRCAYCYFWNKSRKQRPAPPKLETLSYSQLEKTLQKEDAAEATSSEVDEEDETGSGECGNSTDTSSNQPSSEGDSDIEDIPEHASGTLAKNLLLLKGKSQQVVSSKTEDVAKPEEADKSVPISHGIDTHSESLSSESPPPPYEAELELTSSSSNDTNNHESSNPDYKEKPDTESRKAEISTDS